MLHHGDCVEVLKTLPDASVDSVVTDPPYELGFMGKAWDASGIAYSVALWREVLRVLKPGGHLLAFGGTRTYHRMAVAIEDAGFEIRDSLHWLYGSGFPKSLDVSKAIDKAAGAKRNIVAEWKNRASFDENGEGGGGFQRGTIQITEPATAAAKQWAGWGTALKPSHEPIVVARKPLIGTVADNVQQHGTGALNIDGCRVASGPSPSVERRKSAAPGESVGATGWATPARPPEYNEQRPGEQLGRWPPNILLSHMPECGETCADSCAIAELDRQSGTTQSKAAARGGTSPNPMSWGTSRTDGSLVKGHTDSGGASRFFPVFRYQAKASRSERAQGLHEGQTASHPTVKPVALIRWLVRLVTPPRGIVLDPFMGSGTTGVACVFEAFECIGIEREAEYIAIAEARIQHARETLPKQQSLLEFA